MQARTCVCFKISLLVFVFRLRLAELDSKAPFGNSLTPKGCERKCAKFVPVQDEIVSGSEGLELTSIVPTINSPNQRARKHVLNHQGPHYGRKTNMERRQGLVVRCFEVTPIRTLST